jgi:hypothetical protein
MAQVRDLPDDMNPAETGFSSATSLSSLTIHLSIAFSYLFCIMPCFPVQRNMFSLHEAYVATVKVKPCSSFTVVSMSTSSDSKVEALSLKHFAVRFLYTHLLSLCSVAKI